MTSWSFVYSDDGNYYQQSINGTTGYYNGLYVDATAGKLVPNGSTPNSAQFTTGAKISVPVSGKCTISVEAYQPQYSMVDRKWEQLIRWACAQEMGVMTYGTLGGGILTGKYRELKEYGVDDNRNRFYPYFKEPLFSKVMLLLRTMDQISVERNVPLSQIALNWTLQRTFISSCIIGAQSRDKIEENCKVFEWKLSDDEMQLLEQALKKTII